MEFKSILTPQNSIVAGVATVGLVAAIYNLHVGPVTEARATKANHPVLESSRKKAGYMAFIAVAALTLLTKDANIGILGGGTIIALELSYKTGIMAEPVSGRLINPRPESAYAPAQNVVPFDRQGATG